MKHLRVTNIHPTTGNGPSILRVRMGGVTIAEVYVKKRKPYSYLKTLKRSKHFRTLEMQLLPHGVTLTDIGLGVANNGVHDDHT